LIRFLDGFAKIAAGYDGFILDLWGVIHDGVSPYPGATACLAALKGRPVLLLSNAPRRASAVQNMLRQMGIGDDSYAHILTSGEACRTALIARDDPWFAKLGSKVFFLGPARDRNLLDGLDLIVCESPKDADFVLNTGPDDHRDPTDLAAFIPTLNACLDAGLPMLCANPDLEVIRGGVRILCAGALAAEYAKAGGDVRSLGKPDAAIYDRALAMLGVAKTRVLAVGDSLRTDIAGAKNAGIDAVLVAHGVDAPRLGGIFADAPAEQQKARAAFAVLAGGFPIIGVLPRFIW
jgi:HAD superfamily hydrolase (TIGR01459 family)